jgi:hypothetical protein
MDNNYTEKDIISILENPFICQLSNTEYGKMVQSAAEEYIEIKVNQISKEKVLLKVNSSHQLTEQYDYHNNGPGFDRLTKNGGRIQIKFRQVSGKTPYTQQTHFSNTRRHSKKNKGYGDKTGMITYRKDEFDFVLVILCHIKDGFRTEHKKWSFSLIPNHELIDVNNSSFLLPNIPSDKLYKYKCDDIYMLTNKLMKS